MNDEATRLQAELEALYPLVTDAERLQRENEILRNQLEGARRRIDQVTFQRDRQRYQIMRMKNRRFWRLAVAGNQARRSIGALLRFPIAAVRILAGTAPRLPSAPRPPDEAQEAQPSPLAAPADPRRAVELRRRFLAPPTPSTTRDLRIAGILDTFSAASFAPDCHLDTSFRPDNWQEALEVNPPNLLFVESAWKGNGGSWEYQVGSYSYPESVGLPPLSAIVEWCQQRSIPTVFWNKEDPVHFDKFKQAAARFDVVLTTDAQVVPRYQQLPGLRAEVVGALPFAAQPKLHNPLGAPVDREQAAVFAGSFYRNRHEDRREQLEMLLKAAIPFGLVIFDRMRGVKTESTGFPDEFDPYIQGGLPYDEMVYAYKRYRVFLNTNSVTASPTMFSRRVFELLACGTPVVSTPSDGMERMLGSVVRTARTGDEATAHLHELLEDVRTWQKVSQAGIRLVLAEHTYAHRLATMARAAGVDVADGPDPVTLLLTDDGETVEARIGALLGTTLPTSIALLGSSRRPTGHGSHPHVAVLGQDASVDTPSRTRELARHAETPWVAISDGSAVELEIVARLAELRSIATAEVITSSSDGSYGFVDDVPSGPALIRREFVEEHGWDSSIDPVTRGQRLRAAGARTLAVVTGPVVQRGART